MKTEIIRTKKENILTIFPESLTEEYALSAFIEEQNNIFQTKGLTMPIKMDMELLMERDT